jgi:hypothetical protein
LKERLVSLLTDTQHDKGIDFSLSIADFPDAAKEPEQLAEAFKTFPWFFIENTQTVEEIDGRIVKMKLTKPQRYIERQCIEQQKYYNYVDLVILKGRQARISTYVARRGLHYAIWHSHRYTIFANVLEDIAKEGIFEYVWGGYTSLLKKAEKQPYLKELIATARAMKAGSYIEFNGKSHGKVVCQAANLNAVGKNYQFSHLSEVSRMTQFLDLWESFYQGIHKSTFHHLILESTARYTGHQFMDIFKDSVEKEKLKGKPPALKAVFIPAFMVDEYMEYPLQEGDSWEKFYEDENEDMYGPEREIATQLWWDDYDKEHIKMPLNFMRFRREMIDGQLEDNTAGRFSPLDMFKQNFPMTPEEAELSIGDNVFDRKTLDKRKYFPYILPPDYGHTKLVHDVPRFTPNSKGDVSIWTYPEEGLWYTIGFDPSGGNGGDDSVGFVWSPVKKHTAAKFKSNRWSITEQVEMMIAMARYYNNAIINYEANYYGATILRKFQGQSTHNPVGAPYMRLYQRPVFNKPKKGQYHKTVKELKYGFQTNLESKMALVGVLEDAINDFEVGMYSKELIDELWNWKEKRNKEGKITGAPESPKGKNDDEIIAFALSVFLAQEYDKRKDMQSKLKVHAHLNPYDDYDKMRDEIRKGNRMEEPDKMDRDIEKQINRVFGVRRG